MDQTSGMDPNRPHGWDAKLLVQMLAAQLQKSHGAADHAASDAARRAAADAMGYTDASIENLAGLVAQS